MKSRFWNNRPPVSGRRMILEALEERIVMDAAIDSIPDNPSLHHAHSAVSPYDPAGFLGIGNSLILKQLVAGTDSHQAAPAEPASHAADKIAPAFNGSLDVVLVSDALEGQKEIAAAASPNTKVVVYSAANDNLDTLNAKLGELVSAAGKKISHLAVASHGSDGILEVGSDKLDFSSALEHRSSFQSLAKNLDPHAQIQLYSCSLAADDEGKDLVNSIAVMTGADVFASTDVTGAKPHNWTLEYASYAKAPIASLFDANKLEQVPGELAQSAITTLNANSLVLDPTGYGPELQGTSGPVRMPVVGSNIFFVASDGADTNGHEVWDTNGLTTASGQTRQTLMTEPNPHVSELTRTQPGGVIYFGAEENSTTGREVYRNLGGGVAPGMMSDFGDNTGAVAGQIAAFNPHIAQIKADGNGNIYFVGEQPPNMTEAGPTPVPGQGRGFELWKTTGTAPAAGEVTDGTRTAHNVADPAGPGNVTLFNFRYTGSVVDFGIKELNASGDGASMYFAGTGYGTPNGAGLFQGREVWRTDGAQPLLAGTSVTDFGDNAADLGQLGAISAFGDFAGYGSYDPDVTQVTPALNGTKTVYFVGNDPSTGYEVWKSDGTGPNFALGEITHSGIAGNLGNVTAFGDSDPDIHGMVNVPGTQRIYFVANSQTVGTGYEIWRSDGTAPIAGGTDRGAVPETTFALADPDIQQLTTFGTGNLYYVANQGTIATPDYEVFRLTPGSAVGSAPVPVTSFPHTSLLTPTPGTNSLDIYYQNIPADFNPHIRLITQSQGLLWFEADSMGGTGRELYSIDPNATGQQPSQRTFFGLNDPNFQFLTDDGTAPAFVADTQNGREMFTIINDRPATQVTTTTVLEDNNNQNTPITLPNALRIGDPDRNDLLTVDVQAVDGFSTQSGNLALNLTNNHAGFVTVTDLNPGVNPTDNTNWRIQGLAAAGWQQEQFINDVLSTLTVTPTLNTNANTVTSAATSHRIDLTVTDNGVGLLTKVGHLTDFTVPAGVDPNADPGQTPNLTVTPVNDPPTFNTAVGDPVFPGIQITNSITDVVFNTANANQILVRDVDVNETPVVGNTVQVTLNAGDGDLSLSGITGLGFTTGTGTHNGLMTFTGNLTDVNNALNGMRFRPAHYFVGNTGLSVMVSDLTHTGVTANLTDVPLNYKTFNSVPITVTAPAGNFFGRLYDQP